MTTIPSRDAGITAIRKRMRPSHLARQLGISAAAVGQWERVPLERVPEVSRITGIAPWILRPDFFLQMTPPAAPEKTEAA